MLSDQRNWIERDNQAIIANFEIGTAMLAMKIIAAIKTLPLFIREITPPKIVDELSPATDSVTMIGSTLPGM